MTDQKQITLEEALRLVEFEFFQGKWRVKTVSGDVLGSVLGSVKGDVRRDVCGDVCGDVGGSVLHSVCHDVWGDVGGTIKGCRWKFIETPREKLKRLIEEGADTKTLLEAVNELEESSHD